MHLAHMHSTSVNNPHLPHLRDSSTGSHARTHTHTHQTDYYYDM